MAGHDNEKVGFAPDMSGVLQIIDEHLLEGVFPTSMIEQCLNLLLRSDYASYVRNTGLDAGLPEDVGGAARVLLRLRLDFAGHGRPDELLEDLVIAIRFYRLLGQYVYGKIDARRLKIEFRDLRREPQSSTVNNVVYDMGMGLAFVTKDGGFVRPDDAIGLAHSCLSARERIRSYWKAYID